MRRKTINKKREKAYEKNYVNEKYIEVDARNSTLEFMSESILNNDNITKILQPTEEILHECHRYALKSIVFEACEMYSTGMKIVEISKLLKIGRHSIREYLKKGHSIGLCNYKKSTKKPVVQLTLTGKKIEAFNSIDEASYSAGVSSACISSCCNGRRKTAGGFIWKHI